MTMRMVATGEVRGWLRQRSGLVSMVLQDVPPRSSDFRKVEGLVVNMCVRESRRQQGVGRQFMQACLDAAGELGLRRFNLCATSEGGALYAVAAGDVDSLQH